MKIINSKIWILLAGLIVSSCIERYFPETEFNFTPKLVISGTITTENTEQEIDISLSSPSEKPEFIPASGYKVTVEDRKGNSFPFFESGNTGRYLGTPKAGFLVFDGNYRLNVKAPDGKVYVSEYEVLSPSPEVASVYYGLETRQTKDPKISEGGLQFFVDFEADNNYGRFYRWQLVETYEYHSTWPLDKWLDYDGRHDLPFPDYSNYVCYKTTAMDDIFVLSTDGFTRNEFEKYKLHFVKDQTQQLLHKYSLLIKQYSLSETAYNYWENLRKNNQETVNMFGKQPANVKGNIYNLNDTTDVPLGYFGVSDVQSKRIMVQPVQGLHFDHVYKCIALVIDGPLPPDERPLYFAIGYDAKGEPYLGLAGPECIFCTMLGGTTEKPSYWDEK